ncbi:hypothetical protein ACQP2Y_46710 (plasmid) [Actinoplanes sp. CA-051413]|uniref:hypothetical protein n=1 Tax=Actinoplanes sp. CA-051413 TaxID=3239899 RepID=UPI003D963E6A
MTTTPTRAAAAADMDPQIRAQLLRAARGVRQTPTGDVPMGIRYRTPAAPARPVPVDQRPLWMTLAPTGVLEEIAETTPRAGRKTARAATPAPARPSSTPTPAPAAIDTAAQAPVTKPVTRKAPSRKPAPAPRVAEALRPRVLGSYDAFACEACGSRYSQPFPDHGCGPLTPVTVTITTKVAGERA